MRLIFPISVAILDLGAGLVYVYYRQWALGITWIMYAVAAVSLGMVGRE
jgi:hypothetical protein